MAQLLHLIVGSTNFVELVGLQDRYDGSYPTTATVNGVLVDATSTPVTGATAIAMPYITGTSGSTSIYRGVVPAAAVLTVGAAYTLKVTVVDLLGNVRLFSLPAVGTLG